jgi:hypothetical protein
MREMCLWALLTLTISPAFTKMSESTELDEWFTDRLLDSPSHHLGAGESSLVHPLFSA